MNQRWPGRVLLHPPGFAAIWRLDMSDTKDDRRDDGEQAKTESPAGDGPERESWETRAVFRETYLSLYAEPEIRAAYRRVGIAIYEGALAREETYADRGEAPVAADLRAAARDLRVSRGYLEELGAQAETDTQDEGSTRLCLLATETAQSLGVLTRRIEAALGPAPTREA
jgi:hypothetical protein